MNKRSKKESIILGLKKGLTTPNLPEKVIRLRKRWYIVILRMLGRVSIICLLAQEGLNLSFYETLVAMFTGIIYLIYGVVITVIGIKHTWKTIKSDELDIRNSPRDRFGSIFGRVVLCLKGVCICTGSIGGVLGVGTLVDGYLRSRGREPVIEEVLSEGLNKILPPTEYQYNNYLETSNKLKEEKEWYERKLRWSINNKDKEELIRLWEKRIREKDEKMESMGEKIKRIEEYLERKGKK